MSKKWWFTDSGNLSFQVSRVIVDQELNYCKYMSGIFNISYKFLNINCYIHLTNIVSNKVNLSLVLLLWRVKLSDILIN